MQIFPDQPATVTYKMNCGNISAGVPVFALMKNMIPHVGDGPLTVRAFSTNTQKMMYMTLDVLNGEARVDGSTEIGGVPGSGATITVDFRDQGGGFTGATFPTGHLIDHVRMSDGTAVDVTIMDMVNICGFFDAEQFRHRLHRVGLPAPMAPSSRRPGCSSGSPVRLRIAELIGWTQYDLRHHRQGHSSFAVSVTSPKTYIDLDGREVSADSYDVAARFYLESIMHSAAPGSGSTCLAAAAAVLGTVPNRALASGTKDGSGGTFTLGHRREPSRCRLNRSSTRTRCRSIPRPQASPDGADHL